MTKPHLTLSRLLVERGLAKTKTQAEGYIKLGFVRVDGRMLTKPELTVSMNTHLAMIKPIQYVSRGALKLESVADKLDIHFNGKNVLDVGSSTGGFSDFALQHGARHVIAVDIGKDQLHPNLRSNPSLEVYEQTDIRSLKKLSSVPDIVLIDVSFISLKEILPAVSKLISRDTIVIAMAKPQFEVSAQYKHEGILKNNRYRREALSELEKWMKQFFILISKSDSQVSGSKGNLERFYRLQLI